LCLSNCRSSQSTDQEINSVGCANNSKSEMEEKIQSHIAHSKGSEKLASIFLYILIMLVLGLKTAMNLKVHVIME
jgi:hypothetical protein